MTETAHPHPAPVSTVSTQRMVASRAAWRRAARRELPSVAVIVAVYNGERFLADTLESIVAQTLTPTQVIVVDDGSTDSSVELVEASRLAGAVTVVRQANGGQSAARNTGIEHCTTDLVAFIDQDDIWHPDHLSSLVALFGDDTVGWAYSDFAEIDDEGRLVTAEFHRTHGLAHPKTSLADMIGSDLMVLPSAAAVRTSALWAVGGFDPQLCGYEDDDLFIRLFRQHWRPAYLARSTVQFRIHGGSSSVSATFGRSRLVFLDKLVEQVPDNTRLNRYYVRDLVVPRLVRTTVGDFVTCLMHDDLAGAAVAGNVATEVASRVKLGAKLRIGLWALRRPALCRRLLRLRAMLPRPLRQRLLRSVTYRAA